MISFSHRIFTCHQDIPWYSHDSMKITIKTLRFSGGSLLVFSSTCSSWYYHGIVPWMLPWYFSNIFKSQLRPHQPFSVDAASRGQWHAAHPVAPPPGVSMTQCRIQKPQKEQNHHDVCNRICDFVWSFWGCYYIYNYIYMLGFMWFHHSISGGFYVHICSFHPPTFEESKSCGVPAECWHLSEGVRDHRRWVHHLFPDGGNRFWHLQDIQKLASLHALLAQRMGLLEAPSFLIT